MHGHVMPEYILLIPVIETLIQPGYISNANF